MTSLSKDRERTKLKKEVQRLWGMIIDVNQIYKHRYGENWQLPDSEQGRRELVAWVSLWRHHEDAAQKLFFLDQEWTMRHIRDVEVFKLNRFGPNKTTASDVFELMDVKGAPESGDVPYYGYGFCPTATVSLCEHLRKELDEHLEQMIKGGGSMKLTKAQAADYEINSFMPIDLSRDERPQWAEHTTKLFFWQRDNCKCETCGHVAQGALAQITAEEDQRWNRELDELEEETGGITLADAYDMARRGRLTDIECIEPVEFASMKQAEKRDHRRKLKRIAREAASTASNGEQE